MSEPLEGRTALITGGSRGIGRAIARALARAGADVAVNYRRAVGDAESANWEWETGRTVQTFGAVTQDFSAYASGREMHDPHPVERGMNSFQLFYDGTRWYIVTIYWAGEYGDFEGPHAVLEAEMKQG